MMKGLIILALIVSNSFGASIDAFKDLTQAPSVYVAADRCIQLQSKLSAHYSLAVLNNIFNVKNEILPNVDEIFIRIREVEGRDPLPYFKTEVIGLARCNHFIDDVIYNLLQRTIEYETAQLRENDNNINYPQYPMQLEEYLAKKYKIQTLNLYDPTKINSIAFPLKKFPVQLNGVKMTVKERLYTIYNERQIEKMAKVMSFIIDTMNADKVFTTIEFSKDSKRDNYVIDHNAGDIYRLALRLFKQKQIELRTERIFDGKPVSNIDIIAAAYEWGVLTDKEVSILTNDESFYSKEVNFLTKLRKYFTNLGITVAQINPTTAPYALIGVILYNSYQEMNKGQDKVELENLLF